MWLVPAVNVFLMKVILETQINHFLYSLYVCGTYAWQGSPLVILCVMERTTDNLEKGYHVVCLPVQCCGFDPLVDHS